MKQEQKLVPWRLGIIFGAALLLVLMAFGAAGCAESESPDEVDSAESESPDQVDSPDEAAVPTPSDSASDTVISCSGQQYVLCIAASCNQTTGECGVMPSGDSWVPCDQSGVDAGTCGACYVFESTDTYPNLYFPAASVQTEEPDEFGQPYTSCESLASQSMTVSTYSMELKNRYGFAEQGLDSCLTTTSPTIPTANCMGGPCTLNEGNYITFGDSEPVQTATCTCIVDSEDSDPGNYQLWPEIPSDMKPNCSAVWSVG